MKSPFRETRLAVIQFAALLTEQFRGVRTNLMTVRVTYSAGVATHSKRVHTFGWIVNRVSLNEDFAD